MTPSEEIRATAVHTAALILGSHGCREETVNYTVRNVEESAALRQLSRAIGNYIKTGEWD